MSRHVDENQISDFEIEFINNWFSNGFNGMRAYLAIRPDVKESTAAVEATNILKKPNIKSYIDKRQEEIKDNEDIKLSYIVKELKFIIDDAKNDKKTDRVSILKALDQLAKLGGLYTTKTEITTKGEQPLFGPIK